MKANVGAFDRTLRIVLGLAVMAAGYYFSSLWGLIGLIPLVTGLACRCPMYAALGISSLRK